MGSVHQYGTRQAMKTDILQLRKIPFNIGSGLCDILGQDSGTASPHTLNVNQLLLGFIENSRPTFLRIITNHNGHINCAKI